MEERQSPEAQFELVVDCIALYTDAAEQKLTQKLESSHLHSDKQHATRTDSSSIIVLINRLKISLAEYSIITVSNNFMDKRC